MAKKKKNGSRKKVQRSIKILKELDKSMLVTHDSLIEEIEETQRRLAEADRRALKKQRNRLRHEMGVIPYYVSKERVRAREEAIRKLENDRILERVEENLKIAGPLVTIIARLIAALIDLILLIEPIRMKISPDTLRKMNSIHYIAMRVKV